MGYGTGSQVWLMHWSLLGNPYPDTQGIPGEVSIVPWFTPIFKTVVSSSTLRQPALRRLVEFGQGRPTRCDAYPKMSCCPRFPHAIACGSIILRWPTRLP